MNNRQALDAVRNILGNAKATEMARLEPLRKALDPRTPPTVSLPKSPTVTMQQLAGKAKTNLLPLVLDTFSQVMKVDGFSPADGSDGKSQWAHWQRNRFDALQTGVHRSAMSYGASYVVLSAGERGPIWTPRSALTMTALYQDPIVDEWPMMALDVDRQLLRLYDEEQVYTIGQENQPVPYVGYVGAGWQPPAVDNLTFIDAQPHNFGAVPIVRFRDRMLLEGEEQFGIIEPLLAIQQRLDETVFGMLIAQFYSAFRQRYVIGWMPQDEREGLEALASSVWLFKSQGGQNNDPDRIKVGDLEQTDLTRYISAKDAAKADMAAIAQVPAQALGQQGISNVSGAVMDGLETGKDFKAAEIATSFGESYEQLFRGSAHMTGDEAAAADFSAEVRWKNTIAMSIAQATDAYSKWVLSLGVNPKLGRKFLPGWTDQMEAENERLGPSPIGDNADASMQQLLDSIERQGSTAS